MTQKLGFYLVINCKAVPAKGARTHIAGWEKTHGFDIAEELQFVNRINDKIRQRSSVIIDVDNTICVKSGLTDQMRRDHPELPTDADVASHYIEKYKQYIDHTRKQMQMVEAAKTKKI